jgi:serine/threonine-protein kinase PknK
VLKPGRRRPRSHLPVVEGYRDLAEIGRGSFSAVYGATEADTNRTVALKILDVDRVAPHLVDMMTREAQALGVLGAHPNIVTLYRVAQTRDGRPVLVLERCGPSARHRLETSGAYAPDDAVAVGVAIAGALEVAHQADILHRDVKPQNILVTTYGHPALADFGVARLHSSESPLHSVGLTTLHAAPELLEGEAATPATDVYGLASTLYHLIAGHTPFQPLDNEDAASVALRILRDRPASLHGLVTPALDDLLLAALAKDPADRPATAAQFADRLQAIAPHLARPAPGLVTPLPVLPVFSPLVPPVIEPPPTPTPTPTPVPPEHPLERTATGQRPRRQPTPAPPAPAGNGRYVFRGTLVFWLAGVLVVVVTMVLIVVRLLG